MNYKCHMWVCARSQRSNGTMLGSRLRLITLPGSLSCRPATILSHIFVMFSQPGNRPGFVLLETRL